MTEPLDEELRAAMRAGAGLFSPEGAIGTTRSHLVQRLHRRKRQVLSLGAAAVLLMSAGGVALAMNRSATTSSIQVAAGGTNRSTPSTGGTVTAGGGGFTAGTSGGPNPIGATAPGAGPPTSARPVGAHPTTVPAPATTRPTVSAVPPGPPPSTSPVLPGSQVRGTVLFGPVCPVERVPPDPACAPRPGAAHIQLVRADGTVAAESDAGANGQFAIPVAPGSYSVAAGAGPSAVGRGCVASPAQVDIQPGSVSTVAVSCDTGIR